MDAAPEAAGTQGTHDVGRGRARPNYCAKGKKLIFAFGKVKLGSCFVKALNVGFLVEPWCSISRFIEL